MEKKGEFQINNFNYQTSFNSFSQGSISLESPPIPRRMQGTSGLSRGRPLYALLSFTPSTTNETSPFAMFTTTSTTLPARTLFLSLFFLDSALDLLPALVVLDQPLLELAEMLFYPFTY